MPLASFCSWADWFESYLVVNPEDRFSRDAAHIFLLFQRDPNKDYKSTDDPGLKFEFINTVYDLILGLVSQSFCLPALAWHDMSHVTRKSAFRGFRPGKTQTVLRNYRD